MKSSMGRSRELTGCGMRNGGCRLLPAGLMIGLLLVSLISAACSRQSGRGFTAPKFTAIEGMIKTNMVSLNAESVQRTDSFGISPSDRITTLKYMAGGDVRLVVIYSRDDEKFLIMSKMSKDGIAAITSVASSLSPGLGETLSKAVKEHEVTHKTLVEKYGNIKLIVESGEIRMGMLSDDAFANWKIKQFPYGM